MCIILYLLPCTRSIVLLLRHNIRSFCTSPSVSLTAMYQWPTAQETTQLGRKHWEELSLPEHLKAQNESTCLVWSLVSKHLLEKEEREKREAVLLQTCPAFRAVQGGSAQPSPDGAAAFSLARSSLTRTF